MLKETWQQELQDIEQRRNDLVPEHQKMQQTQKLPSLQDKKRAVPEGSGKWAGDNERVIEETHAQLEELGQTTPEDIRDGSGAGRGNQKPASGRGEAAVHLSPTDAAYDPAVVLEADITM